MASPRAVRIPRLRTTSAGPTSPSVGPSPEPWGRDRVERRPNIGGTQRAARLALVFVLTLGVIYLAFVVYALGTPSPSNAGTTSDFLVFDAVAAVFAIVGVVLTLTPAPRALELSPESVVIVGRWGRRVECSPRDEVRVRLERRYPPGLLSALPVLSVSVSTPDRPSRSYLVEEGLFSEDLAPR